jgi:hypothetical protein
MENLEGGQGCLWPPFSITSAPFSDHDHRLNFCNFLPLQRLHDTKDIVQAFIDGEFWRLCKSGAL